MSTTPTPPKPHTPFALMSNDTFLLKDTNGDGIADTVVVADRVDKDAAAEAAKYSGYYRHIQAAQRKAAIENAGRSVLEITAAQNVAEAKAKANWKGPVPPVTKADIVLAKVEQDAKDKKAAINAELIKLSNA